MSTYSTLIDRQAEVLHELALLRSSIHSKLTAILVREDRQSAAEAAIVCRWLDDDTVAAQRLKARAEGIRRFLEGRRHV